MTKIIRLKVLSFDGPYQNAEVEDDESAEITSDHISDASTVGKSVLTAADAAAARLAIGAGTLSAVPEPTDEIVGGVKLGANIAAPAPLMATTDAESTATDITTLLVDHNDLVTKYNALLSDVTALRVLTAALLAQLKAQTIPAAS
jgi:hypothetical protein